MSEHQVAKAMRNQRESNHRIIAMISIGAGLLILGLLALLFLPKMVAGISEEEREYPSAVPVVVDFPAPEVSLSDLEGSPVSLEDYLGQVILVNNWAFWCAPCRAELPILQDYYDDHRHQNFAVIGIEAGGELFDVEYHVDLYRLTYPIWLDPDGKGVRAFRNPGLPNSYVIDSDGQVRLAWNGPISREMLEEHVTPLLEE